MSSNLEIYEKDFEELIKTGENLESALQNATMKQQFWDSVYNTVKKTNSDKSSKELEDIVNKFIEKLPNFQFEYQGWYSESLALIKQLLPDRYDDFVGHYRKPKVNRKDITFENYVIQDALQGLKVTRGYQKEIVVDDTAAIPRFQQQLAILKSLKQRFRSSLFDIKTLVQADVFDSEIDAAQELHKHKFYRGAGAICGVILEKHFGEVCNQHNIKFRKKNLTISDFNDALKNADILDTPKWRNIQFLGDIRNKCDHNKASDPTKEEVQDLIDGTSKVIKTIF